MPKRLLANKCTPSSHNVLYDIALGARFMQFNVENAFTVTIIGWADHSI